MSRDERLLEIDEKTTAFCREAIGLAILLGEEDWRSFPYHLGRQLRDKLNVILEAAEEASVAAKVER